MSRLPAGAGLLAATAVSATGAGDKMKNTHGANTRGAAIGAVTNGWNGSGYDDQRRATILPRVVDST